MSTNRLTRIPIAYYTIQGSHELHERGVNMIQAG